MAICSICGREFDVTHARRVIGAEYGRGMYDYSYPDGDVCEECASGIIGADMATGAELMELMGDSWYDD